MGEPEGHESALTSLKRSYATMAEQESVKFSGQINEQVTIDTSDFSDLEDFLWYSESQEPYPSHPAYDDVFTRIQKDLINIPEGVMKTLDSEPSLSSQMQNLRKTAERLSKIPQLKRAKVALLGNTGSGKSSLLNCLLDMPDLAKSVSSGESCTCVGTEYEASFDEQTKKFAAKVEYFDSDTIEQLLDKLLNDYYIWWYDDRNEWDKNLESGYNDSYQTSKAIFRSLFPNKPEFDEDQEGKIPYLDHRYNDQDSNALATMLAWCRELVDEQLLLADGRVTQKDACNDDERIGILQENDQDELVRQLNPLISNSADSTAPKAWPLVKKVRIGISGPRLLNYVTLVDLPGLNDTNRVRVNAGIELLKSCDVIWIVSTVHRIITNTDVDVLLSTYGKSHGTAVICTNIDAAIEPGLASSLDSQGQSIGNYVELVAQHAPVKNDLAKLTKMKTELAKKGRPMPAKMKKALEEIEGRNTMMRQQIFELLVKARNSHIVRRLRQEKKSYLRPGKALNVFCVSNQHYLRQKGIGEYDGPCLEVNLTGVPTLRSIELQSAGPKIVQNVETYMKSKVKFFINLLNMKSYSMEGNAELLTSLNPSMQKLQECIDKYSRNLSQAIYTILVEQLEASREDAVSAAEDYMKIQRKTRSRSMKAFIRRDGNWQKSKNDPIESWNQKFLEIFNGVIEEQWEDFITRQEELREELKEDLMQLIRDMRNLISEHPAQFRLPMDRLNDIFDAALEGIGEACRQYEQDFDKELRNIKYDMIGDHDGGFFLQAMAEIYNKCKKDSGLGVIERCVNTIVTLMGTTGTSSPFVKVIHDFSSAMERNAETKTGSLVKVTRDALNEAYSQCENMLGEHVVDPSEDELKSKLEEYYNTVRLKYENLNCELVALKQRYESQKA